MGFESVYLDVQSANAAFCRDLRVGLTPGTPRSLLLLLEN